MSAAKDEAFKGFLQEYRRMLSPGHDLSDIEFTFTIAWIMAQGAMVDARVAELNRFMEAQRD